MRSAFRLALCCVILVLALSPWAFTTSHQGPPAAKRLLNIPSDVTGYGLIFLQARVNNSKPMWFALDSGASFPFVIDTRRARTLGLKLQDNRTLEGGAGAGTFAAAMTRGIVVNLGGFEFADQTAAVFALDSLESIAGRRLDGPILAVD